MKSYSKMRDAKCIENIIRIKCIGNKPVIGQWAIFVAAGLARMQRYAPVKQN